MCLVTQCVHVVSILLLLLLYARLSHERATPGESAEGWPSLQPQDAASFSCNQERCVREGLLTKTDQLAGAETRPGNLQGQEVKGWGKGRLRTESTSLPFLSADLGPIRLPTAKLEDLIVSVGQLEPPFDSSVYNYVVPVPADASTIRITVVLPKQDEEDYVVKLEGIPLASGIESPPLEVDSHEGENETLRITVSALAYHPSVYTISTVREVEKKPSGSVRTFLFILTGILLVAVLAFLAYAVYLFVVSGRERGWWPLRYPLREPTPTEYTPIAEAARDAQFPDFPHRPAESEIQSSTTT